MPETHQEIRTLGQLRPHLLAEIKGFFVEYNRLRDRRFKPSADCGPKRARILVEAGMKMFKRGDGAH